MINLRSCLGALTMLMTSLSMAGRVAVGLLPAFSLITGFPVRTQSAPRLGEKIPVKSGALRRLPAQLAVLIAVLVTVSSALQAQSQKPSQTKKYDSDFATVREWILGLQYTDAGKDSYGAIKAHHTSGAQAADGTPYWRVSPYIDNLTVAGLLDSMGKRTPESSRAELEFAARWIGWVFRHLNAASAPDGVPFEHFYKADGTGETVCVLPGDDRLCRYNDATDSAAATFFSLLRTYIRAGGKPSTISSPEHHCALNGMAAALIHLQKSDGLMWAKENYPMKYLEDNCEVYDGLRALSELEQAVYHDKQAADRYLAVANKVKSAIELQLWDAGMQCWRTAKDAKDNSPAIDLNNWSPDMQAQMWPQLFGVVSAGDPRAINAVRCMDERFSGTHGADWASSPEKVNKGFVNADCAYAAVITGDMRRVETYLNAIERLKIDLPVADRFSWPFSSLDGAWLLRTLSRIRQSAP